MSRRKKTRGQPIDGVLLLDKPGGMTSNQALQKCRLLIDARKGGHTGALDPLATGLLPLCFGQATKVSSFLLGSEKSYLVGARLGEVTDTGDADGKVVESRLVEVDISSLGQALRGFVGVYDQVPPIYSALKVNGQPMYKLARQGIDVERKPRRVTAFNIRLLSYQSPDFVFEVDCSSGFYVRSLVTDIGTALGCGAHVTSLRRTRIKQIELAQAISLEAFVDAQTPERRLQYLRPADSLLGDLPPVELDAARGVDIQHGRSVAIEMAASPQQWVRMYGPEQRFLGLGEVTAPGQLAPRRIFV